MRKLHAILLHVSVPEGFEQVSSLHQRPFSVDQSDLLIGRTDSLNALEAAYRSGRRSVAITGEYGTGKTALARVFVDSRGPDLFPRGVSMFTASFPEDMGLSRLLNVD